MEITDHTEVQQVLQDVYCRHHDVGAEMVRDYVAFKRNPTRGRNVFCTAANVKDLKGDLDRDVMCMREESNYQPTYLTREWCDTKLEDEELDLARGCNPDSPVYRVSQDSESGSGYAGTEDKPEEEDISDHPNQETSSEVDDGESMSMHRMRPLSRHNTLIKWMPSTKMAAKKLLHVGSGVQRIQAAVLYV